MPYTQIIDVDNVNDVWQCNDCGAYAGSIKNIVHYKTCVPNESKKWERYYTEANKEEESNNLKGAI